MKKRITHKLRSRRGASITYALLLFLVCAVLCSVIITAGTAAAGRISKMAETDQRYYAVTSAAELLKDMIEDGDPVVVERKEVSEAVNTCNDGIVTRGTAVPKADTTVIKLNGTTVGTIESELGTAGSPTSTIGTDVANNKINQSFATDAALKTVVTSLVTTATDNYYASATSSVTRDLTLTVGSEDDLAVIVTESIAPEGDGSPRRMTFTIRNADKNESGEYVAAADPYTLKLIFEAEGVETEGSRSVDGGRYGYWESEDGTSYSYNFDTTITKTTTTKLTWHLISIQTGA